MKLLFAIYAIIGLIVAPFIYSNNANEYRNGTAGMKIGQALAGGLYWPSYVFSIEPEVNGESFESFQKSLVNIANYRNDKLFTGTRTLEHTNMVASAIGSCAALEGAGNIADAYKIVLSGNIKDEEVNKIRSAVMKRMDGHDFLDLVEEGKNCLNDLLKNKEAKPIKSVIATVAVPMIDKICDDVDNIIKASGLEPKRIDVHGPEDEDAANIGCAYRQNPKAGTEVPKGSVVTYRSWFEFEVEE